MGKVIIICTWIPSTLRGLWRSNLTLGWQRQVDMKMDVHVNYILYYYLSLGAPRPNSDSHQLTPRKGHNHTKGDRQKRSCPCSPLLLSIHKETEEGLTLCRYWLLETKPAYLTHSGASVSFHRALSVLSNCFLSSEVARSRSWFLLKSEDQSFL